MSLEWSRPWGLAALALPVLVLLLARLSARPPELATGTLDLWARIARPHATSGRRARARIPPAMWLLALALALGALALAGPRPGTERTRRTWRAIVDRSPSLYLPFGDRTRLERALSAAEDWLSDAGRAGDEVLWWSPGAGGSEIARGPRPPEAWLVAPRAPRREPAWTDHDEPGALWITDRAPDPEPRRAGLFASGGAAVRGPVAADGRTRFDWDGERLVEISDGLPARAVRLVGPAPPALRGVLGAWAAARGLSVAEADAVEIALDLVTSSVEAVQRVEAGRDGWSARGEAGRLEVRGDRETWLADPRGQPLVACAPGRVDSAWLAMEDPQGDPAAFAVSWAELFDRAVLPPAGVVELHERLDAGPEVVRPPREAGAPGEDRARALAAWLATAALAAILCGFVAAGNVFAR